jgi:hypothetical protein
MSRSRRPIDNALLEDGDEDESLEDDRVRESAIARFAGKRSPPDHESQRFRPGKGTSEPETGRLSPATVDLPTPPFPLATTTTCLTPGICERLGAVPRRGIVGAGLGLRRGMPCGGRVPWFHVMNGSFGGRDKGSWQGCQLMEQYRGDHINAYQRIFMRLRW